MQLIMPEKHQTSAHTISELFGAANWAMLTWVVLECLQQCEPRQAHSFTGRARKSEEWTRFRPAGISCIVPLQEKSRSRTRRGGFGMTDKRAGMKEERRMPPSRLKTAGTQCEKGT